MGRAQTTGITDLLNQMSGGAPGAFTQLVDVAYKDLKRIAARRLADGFVEPVGGLTLQPTAILHDALMDLRRQRAQIKNSDHFFAIATTLIEHVISDYRKRRRAQKRGGGKRGVSIDDRDGAAMELVAPDDSLVSPVFDVLERLKSEYPRKAEVVTLHIICGHSIPKVAEMINLSVSQTERDWAFARKWLKRELKDAEK